MINTIMKWFRKEGSEVELHPPNNEEGKFTLKLNDIEIGYLECREGIWKFYYSEMFKKMDKYHHIIGFSKLDKIYTNEALWPFFQIRIPGLGQPAVKEILAKENIDKKNEFALLKRFGFKTIANPYTLVLD